jgi:hypothetical protein
MAIFNGLHVRIAGILLAVISAPFILHSGHLIGFYAGVMLFLLNQIFPNLFNWLKNFAEPKVWPSYVGLGIAIMFAAHQGGWAALPVGGILTSIDGLFFDSLY